MLVIIGIYISDLGHIFAEGNIPATFQSFETDHVCNRFCMRFGLPADYEDCDVAT
jgi:hypothetical protein